MNLVDHNTSPQYKFRTPPSPATASTSRIRVGIFGDLGRAEQDSALNFASNEVPAINSTEHLTKALEQGKLDLVVHIGKAPGGGVQVRGSWARGEDLMYRSLGGSGRQLPWVIFMVQPLLSPIT